MKIGKQTYGLLLISDNWNGRLRDADCIDILKEKLKDTSVDCVNSWTLFGVHDTAVLLRSEGRLDSAIDTMGGWVRDCTRKMDKEGVSSLPSNIKDYINKYRRLSDIYKEVDYKKFKIFEYRLDPLIPIYIDDGIKSSNDVFLIMYIKFNPTSVNNLLNENGRNLGDLYKPFIEDLDATSVFQGFGLFDVITITKGDTYKKVEDVRTKIRTKFDKPSISSTYSLTSVSRPASRDANNLGFPSLNSFMRLKIRPAKDDPEIWDNVRNLAKDLGLSRICIKETMPSNQSPPYTAYIPGFFDVEIGVQFTNIEDLINFWDALEHLYFVEDTATVISYDTNVVGANSNGNTTV